MATRCCLNIAQTRESSPGGTGGVHPEGHAGRVGITCPQGPRYTAIREHARTHTHVCTRRHTACYCVSSVAVATVYPKLSALRQLRLLASPCWQTAGRTGRPGLIVGVHGAAFLSPDSFPPVFLLLGAPPSVSHPSSPEAPSATLAGEGVSAESAAREVRARCLEAPFLEQVGRQSWLVGS